MRSFSLLALLTAPLMAQTPATVQVTATAPAVGNGGGKAVKCALLAILILPLASCAPVLNLTCAPTAVEDGGKTTCTVTLGVPAPTDGAVIDLTFLGLSGPATITIPQGQTVGQFVVEAK